MNDHLQACEYCPKYREHMMLGKLVGICTIYHDTSWVNRRGGCPVFPERDMAGSPSLRKQRAGQQKQKHTDRTYHSKNDRKTKFRRDSS